MGLFIEETRYTSPALLAGQAGFTDEFINSHKQQIDEITKNESGDTYEYVGLYLDAEGTKPINSSIRFNEDATVYMVWKEKVAAKPVEPDKQKPVETNKTESVTKSNTEKKKKPVQTSDNQSIMIYGILITITATMFFVVKFKKLSGE